MSLSQQWKDDLQREYDFQDGVVDYPPFVQFAGRTPFLTPLLNLVVWGWAPCSAPPPSPAWRWGA